MDSCQWRVILAALLLLSGVAIAPGCSGGGDDEEQVVFDLTGAWGGRWVMVGFSGDLAVALVQDGGSLSGSITIQGSPCMRTAAVTGSVAGDTVTIGAVAASNNRYDYAGTIQDDGKGISGTWTGAGPCAGNTNGTFSLAKQ